MNWNKTGMWFVFALVLNIAPSTAWAIEGFWSIHHLAMIGVSIAFAPYFYYMADEMET